MPKDQISTASLPIVYPFRPLSYEPKGRFEPHSHKSDIIVDTDHGHVLVKPRISQSMFCESRALRHVCTFGEVARQIHRGDLLLVVYKILLRPFSFSLQALSISTKIRSFWFHISTPNSSRSILRMQFFATFVAALSVAATANAAAISKRALTAQQMVDNINAITQQSQMLQPVVSNIQTGQTSIESSQLSNPFQPVIAGFQAIIKTASTDINAMSGTQPYDAADAQGVCTAFRDFVVVHQELLKIVIGKSGLLEGLFLAPVAAVLRSLEGAVDTLAFGIIDSVPTCQADATQDKSSLDATLGQAVCAYTPGGSMGVTAFC